MRDRSAVERRRSFLLASFSKEEFMRFKNTILVLAIVAFTAAGLGAQPLLSAGTQTPFQLTRTPGGNFVLAESGTGVNDGRISLVSLWGNRYNLLGGLPSGFVPEGDAIGPTAVADAHSTLYIVIGEGDVRGPSPGPPQEVPNPDGLSSPIFSSIIRARFTPVPDGIRTGFELTAADVDALADGNEITLQNDSGEEVQLLLLVDFPDLLPDPVKSVRNSNPFAAAIVGSLTTEDLTEFGFEGTSLEGANFYARLNWDTPIGHRLEERSKIYVVNAGMDTVTEVAASTGRSRVITRFPPVTNPLFPGLGGPVTDAVPTTIFVRADGALLVTTLTGFPFAAGVAKVYSVDPVSGAFTPWIEGLTTATNVIEVGGATYVLEISTDFLAGEPGRLLRFESPSATPTVLAGGLIGPTGLAYEPMRNELIVSETFTGLVKRIALAP
jgi:hypothetical protein